MDELEFTFLIAFCIVLFLERGTGCSLFMYYLGPFGADFGSFYQFWLTNRFDSWQKAG